MATSITLKELQDFHTIDRQVYARLVISLGFDPHQSKKIVAFWNWLEKRGCRNLVKIMQTVSDALFNALAHEAITCINCLNKECFDLIPYFIDNDKYVPLMRKLVIQDFSLEFVYENKKSLIGKIDAFMKDVGDKAFCDIVPRNLVNEFQALGTTNESSVLYGQVLASYNETKTNSFYEFSHNNGCDSQVEISQEAANKSQSLANNVPKKDRTLFVTFSRGHRITKWQLKGLFTSKYGDCVEAVYMKTQPLPLFGYVVVRSPSLLAEILGDNELVKFSLNGKDVWVRRFLRKRSCKYLAR